MAFEPAPRVAYLCRMESDDPAAPEDMQDDLPETPEDGLDDVGDEVVDEADDLPAEIEMEPEEISSGIDLNSPDASAAMQSLFAIGLRDAFASAGRGWGHTYGHTLRPRFSFLRIDHVLVSDDVAVVRAFTGGKDASDHRPVVADLRLPQR